MTLSLTRREFVAASAAAGAGLVIAFYLPDGAGASPDFAPNAWLKISPEGEVTVVVARSEMGQGVRTALPILVAEELEADWTKIRVEQAPANRQLYGDQTTGGSASVREGWGPLRKAGATAREMLIAAAAKRWGVAKSSCRAENGAVLHPATSRRLTYGELAAEAASLPVPTEAPLKDAKDFRLIGKPTPRLDTPSKVDGSAEFSLDFRQPGMLYAVIARPPAFGGKLKGVDDKQARAVPGVRDVIELGDGVAVVAESVWPAMEGRRALDLQWDDGPNAKLSSAAIRQMFDEAAKKGGHVWRNDGDFAATFASAAKKLEATYEVPYLAHAPMEPENCTAHFQKDRCEVWAPTQVPQQTQREVAKAVGLTPSAVRVNVTLLGGGFGRRLEEDFAVEAALISKAVGAPAKVVWSREDDMRHDFYRPASLHRMSGALDAQGWPAAFAHTVAGPSILARWSEEVVKSGQD
ncbi:MAG: molybdopterin cofactor-binding domain-containing protein, partial [Terriglobales bacterium]